MIISFNTGKISTNNSGGLLQQKRIEVTGNGLDVVVPDAGYDGLSTVYVKTVVGDGGVEGYNFSDIGYDRETNNLINDEIRDSINYSKTILDNWDASITTLQQKFQKDVRLTYFPIVDTSKVESFSSTFNGCTNLQYVPELNTSNATTLYYTFNGCSSLVYSPDLDTSNVTDYRYCFSGCKSLKRLPKFSMKNMPTQPFADVAYKGYRMFYDVPSVTDFGGFVDCEHITYWSQSAYSPFDNLPALENVEEMGVFKANIFLRKSPKLTVDSLMVFIKSAYNFTGNGETPNLDQGKLTIGSTNLAKLTEEQIAIATDKGWVLS